MFFFLLMATNNYNSHLYLSNELHFTPNGYCMQKFHSLEVDISTSHLKAFNPFGTSSPSVRVLVL
jgi:hypothetical protein